jgi:hypothetical protein
VLGSTLENLLSGNMRGLAGMGFGQMNGTRALHNSYAGK